MIRPQGLLRRLAFMHKTKVWINGRFFGAGSAKVSVFDRGFLYGDGLFETMRAYNGRILKLGGHLSRLFGSAKIMMMNIPYSKKNLERAVYKTLKSNRLKEAYIRLTVTRGEGAFTLKGGRISKPNIVIAVKEFTPYPERSYSCGISAGISDITKDEHSPLSKIKTLNFLDCILARMRARSDGFDEAILENSKGCVAEAATSNIFLVKEGRLATPSLDSGILPGITRAAVIRIAGRLGIDVAERAVYRNELTGADEVFLTNTLAEIMPVVKIDHMPIGGGRPGRITKLLHKAYQQTV